MRKLLAPFHFIQNIFLKLYVKLFLPKHKFKVGDLVFKEGTRSLYEVDELYYDKELYPVTVVRPYPIGTQVFAVGRFDILEFKEFKGSLTQGYNTTPSDVGLTAHDNQNFAKGVKVKK